MTIAILGGICALCVVMLFVAMTAIDGYMIRLKHTLGLSHTNSADDVLEEIKRLKKAAGQ